MQVLELLAGLPWRPVDGRRSTKLGRRGRPAGRCAAADAAALAAARAGPALAAAAAGAAVAAAGAGQLRGGGRRHRPGHGGAGAHPRAPAGLRRRAALFSRGRCRAARAAAAAARPRRAPHRPADAEPQRHRPCRRRGLAAGAAAGARAVQLAARRACAAARRRAAPPLPGRPGLGLGRRALRAAAPAAGRLCAGRAPQRAELRAACAGRGRAQPAAHRRHRSRAGGGAAGAHRPGAAQPGAAGAAPRQPHVVDRGLHRRRRAGHGPGAGRLPQPFRPPGARGGGALSRAGRGAACAATAAAPGSGRRRASHCLRQSAPRYWHHRADAGAGAVP